MPTPSSTSKANAVTADATAVKKRQRGGILVLYTNYARRHVKFYEEKGKVNRISRKKVERNVLKAIDKSDIPIAHKFRWCEAVLVSLYFQSFWMSVADEHNLPKKCTARLVLDEIPLEYDEPTDDEAEEGVEAEVDNKADDAVEDEIHNANHDIATAAKNISPTSNPQTPALVTDHGSRPSSPDSDHGSQSSSSDFAPELDPAALLPIKRTIPKCDLCNKHGHAAFQCYKKYENNDTDWSSDDSDDVPGGHEAKVLAKRLFAGIPMGSQPVSDTAHTSYKVHEDPRAALRAVNGLTREGGDDGSYNESQSTEKGKGKAKASTTVKAASKPQGVTKQKAAPNTKEKKPTQLMTAAAETREPAKPKATKQAPTTPSHVATTPGQAAYANSVKHARASTAPDELDAKIARIQAQSAPARAAGIKRMMEQFPDDDDDDEDYSPAAKKAKTGGTASANGGRKMVTPKKSSGSRKKGLDGIHRGFGEY